MRLNRTTFLVLLLTGAFALRLGAVLAWRDIDTGPTGEASADDVQFHRIACRDLVMRNLLALSSGVQKTMYWDLWHDTSNRDDLMHLMYARFRLLDYDGGVLKKRYPSADAFRRMTEALDGVESVRRVEVPGRPAIYLFEVSRRKWDPVFVVLERRDVFSGEDQPAVTFERAWDTPAAKAFDALGQDVHARVTDGRLSLPVSATPIFIEATK